MIRRGRTSTRGKGWASIKFIILLSMALTSCTLVYTLKLNGTVTKPGCLELSIIYPLTDRNKEHVFPVSDIGKFNDQIKFFDILPGRVVFMCNQDTVGSAIVTKISKNHVSLTIKGESKGNQWIRKEEWDVRKTPFVIDSLMF